MKLKNTPFLCRRIKTASLRPRMNGSRDSASTKVALGFGLFGAPFFIFVLIISFRYAQAQDNKTVGNQSKEETDQQISGFSLAGYGEKGKKAWDVSGKSADILTDVVKLNDVTGNLYGEKENVKLTADNGDFNKSDGKVHLEKNVVVTTSSGAKLTTDSLDWDRKEQMVSTPDKVNIRKDNIDAVASGIYRRSGNQIPESSNCS